MDKNFNESHYVNFIFLLDKISTDISHQLNLKILSNDLYQLSRILELITKDKNVSNNLQCASSVNEMLSVNESVLSPPTDEIYLIKDQIPICRYYQYGFCVRGETCKFQHENKALIQVNPLQHWTGKIYLMALDKYNCRLLQKELETKNIDMINSIYYEIIDHIVELMSHPVGNYLCQKLLDLINPNQRFVLLNYCEYFLIEMSSTQYGTRSVQKLIDVIETDVEFSIIQRAFQDHVVKMIHDLNGNHVIRKCLHKMTVYGKSQFIYDSISANCIAVTTNPYGCHIFKDCIEYGSMAQKLQLIDCIEANMLFIVQDAFGNYIIQHILDVKLDAKFPTKIVERLTGQIYQLSKQKFSSNVIEKCLKVGDNDCVRHIMNEFIFNPKINTNESYFRLKVRDEIVKLLQDDFGNYVIQTCLNESLTKAPKEYLLMIKLLLPIQRQLSCTSYGKKISHHLEIIK